MICSASTILKLLAVYQKLAFLQTALSKAHWLGRVHCNQSKSRNEKTSC